jgi:hypothetical protein
MYALSHDTHGGSFLNPERSNLLGTEATYVSSCYPLVVKRQIRIAGLQVEGLPPSHVSVCMGGVVQYRVGACLGAISSPCAMWRYATILQTVSRVGILAFQAGLHLPRAADLVPPNRLVLRWIRSIVYSARPPLPLPKGVGSACIFCHIGRRVFVVRD